MPDLHGRAAGRYRTIALGLIAMVLAVMVIAPIGALAAPSNSPSATVHPEQATGALTASATWDGTNVATAANVSAAFHISFNGAVTIVYDWSQGTGGVSASPWQINDARLEIFYFGFALGTRDISTTTGASAGSLTMGNWNMGALQYILEGTYLLTASLLSSNGTTAWSQSFWVDVSAPFYILAILPLVLVLIAIYEIYALSTCGKQAALPKQPAKGTPPTTPVETSGTPPASSSEPPDPAEVSAPAETPTPPIGGS